MRQFARTYRVKRTAFQRFCAKVQLPTEWKEEACWVWTGNRAAEYGTFPVKENGVWQRWLAHRYSYTRFVGPIPEGLHLDHLCRNPKCVNPEHLEAVTCKENCLRGMAPSAIKARMTHCLIGHPLTGKNLYIYPSSGNRKCRTCHRLKERVLRWTRAYGLAPPTGDEWLPILRAGG